MILGIDSTTERLHLALVAGDRAWTRGIPVGQGHSHSHALLPAISELMAEAGAGPARLTGVAACVGPGGFTSLRIGVATAEGLALTGLPTWGFSAFELRAKALGEAGVPGPFWILLDGQRQEAFVQKWGGAALSEAERRPMASLPHHLGGLPWWAPQAFHSRLDPILGPCPIKLPDEGDATLRGLVALCRERVGQVPESPLVPFYLRETDAEVNFPAASTHLSPALRQGLAR
ncbi:tRNA (adenosine(37)-N6)-threonylcarbamoyltransferase complex dimerization subunit type 1 TsaB [Holophaga foetida]|uniref:tRNA (adenosine(37)-N6)-threonylcarbamoyltransferase complex dimerization subunit type 1 TsaB n=1 Tax=Holophaga foetida TaxID=35839 RepID=UPI0002472F3E|nr:tRNA (adenosine(37)-N6)-threonylcarbamoyltransferase complex dimerization subunit type 1 TsaB [Holophaga foetida]